MNKDQLTQIISESIRGRVNLHKINEIASIVADRLIKKIVLLPDLKYKQELYMIYDSKIKTLEVSSYQIRPDFDNLLQIHLYKNGFNGCCTSDDFGKTVFLTKKEAEDALREMLKNEKNNT